MVSDATTAIFPTDGSRAIGAVPGRKGRRAPTRGRRRRRGPVRVAATSAWRRWRRMESSGRRLRPRGARGRSTPNRTRTRRGTRLSRRSAPVVATITPSVPSRLGRSRGGEGGSREGSEGGASRGPRDAPADRRGAPLVRPLRRDDPRRPLASTGTSSRSTPAWMRSGERLTSGSSRLTARSSRSTAVTGSRRARPTRYSSSEITFPMTSR